MLTKRKEGGGDVGSQDRELVVGSKLELCSSCLSLSHGEELLLLSQPLSQRYCTLLLPATALSVVPKLEPAHPIIPQCYQAA